MKKSIFTVFLFLSFLSSFSQTDRYNKKIMDPKAKEEILLGFCMRAGLESGVFAQYFKDEYSRYVPDKNTTEQVESKMLGVIITVVMGTWCSDSREQIPRLFKILDATGYRDAVSIICVDKDKKAGSISLDDMKIEKVPTIIFYKENKELGRIVETPTGTLEQDMVAILSK